VRNALFLRIPAESELPERYRTLPPEYTTCLIFRWAACFFEKRTAQQEPLNHHPAQFPAP
jgi:hypothetical protein